MTRTWETNADEYRDLAQETGWAFAVLVACSVEKDTDNGVHHSDLDGGANVPPSTKTSARLFAQRAGTNHQRVLRYLGAWEAAAAEGLVPAAGSLTPDDVRNVSLPDVPIRGRLGGTDSGRLTPEERTRYDEVADEYDTTASEVARVASSQKAIQAAIHAEPAVAEAAREALRELHQEEHQQQDAASLQLPPPDAGGFTDRGQQELSRAAAELAAGKAALRAGDNAIDSAVVRASYIIHRHVTLSGNPRAREILENFAGWVRSEIEILEGEAGVSAGAAAFLRDQAR